MFSISGLLLYFGQGQTSNTFIFHFSLLGIWLTFENDHSNRCFFTPIQTYNDDKMQKRILKIDYSKILLPLKYLKRSSLHYSVFAT